MMILLKHIEVALLCLAALLVGAGEELALPILEGAGILLMGMVTLSFGLQPLLFREVTATNDKGEVLSSYESLARIFRSIFLMLIGLWIVGFGLLCWLSSRASILDSLKQQPEIILVTFSAFCFTLGASNTLTFMEERGSWMEVLKSIPARLFNFGLALIGFTGICLGLLRLIAPTEFESLAKMMF